MRRNLAMIGAALVAVLAVGGCGPEGMKTIDAHGNTASCAPPVLPTGPVPTPTSVTVECGIDPPAPPSSSPSPVIVPSPSPSSVEVPVPVPVVLPDVRGGYYLASQGNMTVDAATLAASGGHGIEAFTQYRSIGAQLAGQDMVFPGYGPNYAYLTPWINDLDRMGIFAVENTCFAASDCTARTFTVEGQTYSVPASAMQQNIRADGTVCQAGATIENAYGYTAVTSGALDGLLHSALAQTRKYTGPLVWQIFSEVDTDAECGVKENGIHVDRATANARAAAQVVYMIDWLRDPPGTIEPIAANVKFTVGMGGFHAPSYDQVYTAGVRERVDYYNFNTYWRTPTQSSWAVAMAGDLANVRDKGWDPKPIVITEFGTPLNATTTPNWSTTQAERIERFPRALWDVNNVAIDDSDVIGAVYFNSNPTWSTFNPKPDGLAGLRRAYNDTLFSRQGE